MRQYEYYDSEVYDVTDKDELTDETAIGTVLIWPSEKAYLAIYYGDGVHTMEEQRFDTHDDATDWIQKIHEWRRLGQLT
jgi:hypothetical protein